MPVVLKWTNHNRCKKYRNIEAIFEKIQKSKNINFEIIKNIYRENAV